MSKEIEDIGAPSPEISSGVCIVGALTCSYKRLENSATFGDGPLENLLGWGVGGAVEVQKKKFAQGKIKWKKFLHAN